MISLKDIFRKKQVYNSVRDLPMSVFIDIVCGVIPEPENWQTLFEEYQSLSKDNKSTIFLSLLKDITFNENQIYLTQVLLYSLSVNYNDEVAGQLRTPRFKFTRESYKRDIEITLSGLKSQSIKLKEKKDKLQQLSKGEKPKPTDWDMQFVYLSKFMGVKMTAHNTSVSEYINAINYLKEATKNNGK